MINSCLQVSMFSAKAVFKIIPQNGGFEGKGSLNFKFQFCDPKKAHLWVEPHIRTYFASKSMQGSWLWIILRTSQKLVSHFGPDGVRNFACREKTPWSNLDKVCTVVGIPDVITCANFGDDWLMDFGVAMGQYVCCWCSSAVLMQV